MFPILASTGVGLGTYALTKTLSHLSTPPEPQSREISLFRKYIIQIQQEIQTRLGPRHWSYTSEVIWDNLWVSAFVLTFLLTAGSPKPDYETVLNSFIFLLGGTTLSWVGRIALYKAFWACKLYRAGAVVAPRQ